MHLWLGFLKQFTLWLFNIAMENSPFIDDFPINTSIYKGFSMAMLNNQRVKLGFVFGGYECIWWSDDIFNIENYGKGSTERRNPTRQSLDFFSTWLIPIERCGPSILVHKTNQLLGVTFLQQLGHDFFGAPALPPTLWSVPWRPITGDSFWGTSSHQLLV